MKKEKEEKEKGREEWRTTTVEPLSDKALKKMERMGIKKKPDLLHQLLHKWATSPDQPIQ